MDGKTLKRLFLVALVLLQAGCATESPTSDDTTPALEPVPSHDDSHGWGTNVQAGAH
jgi:uncharacterized lipoprotein YajG